MMAERKKKTTQTVGFNFAEAAPRRKPAARDDSAEDDFGGFQADDNALQSILDETGVQVTITHIQSMYL